jgi:hypothetical protein
MNSFKAISTAHGALSALKIGCTIKRESYGAIVAAYNELAETEAYIDLADRLKNACPHIIAAYDERGQYVGSVSNENGWSA